MQYVFSGRSSSATDWSERVQVASAASDESSSIYATRVVRNVPPFLNGRVSSSPDSTSCVKSDVVPSSSYIVSSYRVAPVTASNDTTPAFDMEKLVGVGMVLSTASKDIEENLI